MASTQTATVDIEGEQIRVQELVTEDPEAAEFLSTQDEDTAATFVQEAFEVGLTAMRLTQTTVDVQPRTEFLQSRRHLLRRLRCEPTP
jgi:hypothetical protein